MITLDLNVGVPKPHTGSGVPSIDEMIKLEQGGFLTTEAKQFIRLNLPPFLATELDETLITEASEPIQTQ